MKDQNIPSGAVVGDRTSDIIAAIDNNLISIAVHFDFAQLEEIEKAHYIVEKFPQLKDFILQLSNSGVIK